MTNLELKFWFDTNFFLIQLRISYDLYFMDCGHVIQAKIEEIKLEKEHKSFLSQTVNIDLFMHS